MTRITEILETVESGDLTDGQIGDLHIELTDLFTAVRGGEVEGIDATDLDTLRVVVETTELLSVAAAERFGQDDRRVVARLDDQTVKQFVDGGRAGRIDEHPRADRLVGIGRDRRACVQGELLVLDRIEGEIGGHQLGERRRLDPHVGVACGQQLTGGEIHEQP